MLKSSLLVLLAILLSEAGMAQSGKEALDEEQLEEIEDTISRVKKEVGELNEERSDVRKQLDSSEVAIAETQQQVTALNQQIAVEQKNLDTLRTHVADLEKRRSDQQTILGQYLRSAWMSGEGEHLKLLLNQSDPAEQARMGRYYSYFSTARTKRITTFNTTLQQLDDVSNELTANTAKLTEQQQVLETQQTLLSNRQSERKTLLAKLDSQLSTRNTELNRLEQQRVEIQLVLDELQRSIAELGLGQNAEPFAGKKGQLPWPVEGRVVHSFGSKHEFGDLTYEGITLSAKAGTPVKALHPGRVVYADWLGSSGLLLIIDHGDGYMSLYAHNQELYKTVGTWVGSGDTIAAVGDSGGQLEPGLYFEIRRDGKAENPVNWCIPRN